MLLFYALHNTGGSTRQDTVDYIAQEGWFVHADEDNKPYPFAGHNEPRWRVLIAFGRKDAYDRDRLFRNQRDHWELNRQGADEFRAVLSHFKSGKGDVAKGYLWTPRFKKLLDPSYAPTSADAPRPKTIYNRILTRALREWILSHL